MEIEYIKEDAKRYGIQQAILLYTIHKGCFYDSAKNYGIKAAAISYEHLESFMPFIHDKGWVFRETQKLIDVGLVCEIPPSFDHKANKINILFVTESYTSIQELDSGGHNPIAICSPVATVCGLLADCIRFHIRQYDCPPVQQSVSGGNYTKYNHKFIVSICDHITRDIDMILNAVDSLKCAGHISNYYTVPQGVTGFLDVYIKLDSD